MICPALEEVRAGMADVPNGVALAFRASRAVYVLHAHGWVVPKVTSALRIRSLAGAAIHLHGDAATPACALPGTW